MTVPPIRRHQLSPDIARRVGAHAILVAPRTTTHSVVLLERIAADGLPEHLLHQAFAGPGTVSNVPNESGSAVIDWVLADMALSLATTDARACPDR